MDRVELFSARSVLDSSAGIAAFRLQEPGLVSLKDYVDFTVKGREFKVTNISPESGTVKSTS